jgi:hypothetical protein
MNLGGARREAFERGAHRWQMVECNEVAFAKPYDDVNAFCGFLQAATYIVQ